MYALKESIDSINLVGRQIVAIASSGSEPLPEFIPSWRPGDTLTLPDEHAGAVVIDDLEGFDPAALGLT